MWHVKFQSPRQGCYVRASCPVPLFSLFAGLCAITSEDLDRKNNAERRERMEKIWNVAKTLMRMRLIFYPILHTKGMQLTGLDMLNSPVSCFLSCIYSWNHIKKDHCILEKLKSLALFKNLLPFMAQRENIFIGTFSRNVPMHLFMIWQVCLEPVEIVLVDEVSDNVAKGRAACPPILLCCYCSCLFPYKGRSITALWKN